MLNLELLINFSNEFLMDKAQDSVHEGIYYVLFDTAEKFLHGVKLEYETIFSCLSIGDEEIDRIEDIDKSMSEYLVKLEKAMPKKFNKKHNDIFDSIIMDDGNDEFNEYSMKDTSALIYDIELQWEEYRENCLARERKLVKGLNGEMVSSNNLVDSSMDQKVNSYRKSRYFNSFNKRNFKNIKGKLPMKLNSSLSIKKRSKSFESQESAENEDNYLSLSFCESLIEKYSSIVQKCNYNVSKLLADLGFSKLTQDISSFLESANCNNLFLYIKNRVSITESVVKLLKEINRKSFRLYEDKVFKKDTEQVSPRKNSTMSKNLKELTTGIESQKLSFYLSRIRSLPFSNENQSLMEEINVMIREHRRFSEIGLENGLEQVREMELGKEDQDNVEDSESTFQREGRCCYCVIF